MSNQTEKRHHAHPLLAGDVPLLSEALGEGTSTPTGPRVHSLAGAGHGCEHLWGPAKEPGSALGPGGHKDEPDAALGGAGSTRDAREVGQARGKDT